MSDIAIHYFNSPVGELILGTYANQLVLLDFRYRALRERIDRRLQKGLRADYIPARTPLMDELMDQLKAYFKGKQPDFDLPIRMVGTDFQMKVWRTLQDIPYGTTITYGEQARRLGRPDAVRAVASANGANALAIIIPCHRVVGRDGALTGYGGGISTKKKLLELEGMWTNGML
ncbi:MAG: methylated-DNA--[protein]-cysteine S-methyltransferase [Calditrichaeota bacterium]|nr:MAG: methylated-DNA--[protein]-cysteine S-methyltransferase [Calditrichota bacterium]